MVLDRPTLLKDIFSLHVRVDKGDFMTTEDKLKAWEDFGASIKPIIPVLIGQLKGVVEETERAAGNLIERFQIISHKVLSSKETQNAQAATELAKDIAQVVMYIQFQDITRQQIEHVYGPLENMLDYLGALHCDDQDAAVQQQTLEKLKSFSMGYTMESERILMKEIQDGRTLGSGEKTSQPAQVQEAAVTLF